MPLPSAPILVLIMLVAGAPTAGAAPADDSASIDYRRIFVPANDLTAWPRGDDKYLPIEADDFDAMVAAANRSAGHGRPAATITEATYSARLEGQRLVDRRGWWQVELRGDRPAILPLDHRSPSIANPRWVSEGVPPARVGAWGEDGSPPSRFGLEVPSSGRLEFQWDVPTQETHDGCEVALRLPPALLTRLVLDLPEGAEPRIEGSVVLESRLLSPEARSTVPDASRRSDADASARASRDAQTTPRRRWTLAVAPPVDGTLRIVSADSEQASPPPRLAISETLEYEINERGLDVIVILDLRGRPADERRLVVPLPAGVQLLEVSSGGRELPWEVTEGDEATASSAVVELPPGNDETSAPIAFRAWQPLKTGSRWTMPVLRPQRSFWTDGSIELSIAPTIELRDLSAIECRRSGVVSALENDARLERWSLQPYSPAAKVEVTVGPRRPEAAVRMGTNLEVDDPNVTARATTQLELVRGSLHAVSADVRPGWIIESVQTEPADALDAWYVDDQQGRRRLEIRLARAVREMAELKVVVTGRLQRSGPLDPLAARSLGLIEWRGMKIARHLLAIRTREPYVVESTAGLPAIAPRALSAADHALVETPGSGEIYDLAEASGDAAVKLAFRRGNYQANIHLDVTCTGDERHVAYRITCAPQGSQIDRLLVHFSEPPSADLQWTVPATGARVAAERVAADGPVAARRPSLGELWQLRLRRPSAEPVEIVGTAAEPWTGRAALPLVWLPEANRQQARISVRSDGDPWPLVEPLGLVPVPLQSGGTARPETSDTNGRPRVLAAYRYDPDQWQDESRRSQLWLSPGVGDTRPNRVVARRARLTSHYAGDGTASHRLTYLLENDGAGSVELVMPTDARLANAQIDGRPAAWSNDPDESATVSFDLPREGPSEISLDFHTRQAPLAVGSRLAPPLPDGSIPLLAGEWNVVLPDDFEIVEAPNFAHESFDWRRRLFGPLGRAASHRGVERASGEAFEAARVAAAAGNYEAAAGHLGSSTAATPTPDGWRAYHLPFIANEPATIVLTHVPRMKTWAISVFLLGMVAGYAMRRGVPTMYIAALALAAGLALLLPPAYAPLASGALLGLAASLLVGRPRRISIPDAPTKLLQQMSTVGSILVALLAGSWGSAAAESRGADTVGPGNAAVESVLIPVDADGQIVGDKQYVSERFLAKLLRHAAQQDSLDHDWLVRTAEVRGKLTHNSDQSELVCGSWTLALEVQSMTRDATIELPLVREEAEWPASAMLDGIPAPIRWNADGTRAVVEIAEPGTYELSLTFTPAVRLVDPRHEVTLTLPSLFHTELHLSYPPEMFALEVHGAEVVEEDRASGTLRAAMDEAGRLGLAWPRDVVPMAGRASPRIRELRWLQIEPDAVVLDVKYLAERGGHPSSLLVAADAAWHLTTGDDVGPNVELDETNGRRLFRVPLIDDPSGDGPSRSEGRLRLRLARQSPLGQIRLPRLERIAGTDADFDFCISIDGALDGRVLGSEQHATGDSDEFLAAWGPRPLTDVPLIVLAELLPSDSVELAVRPRDALSRIDEVLHLAAREEALAVQYQADVEPGEMRRYQFSLDVPAELTIDDVLMSRGGQRVPLRWVRLSDEQVNVFFGREVQEPYRLVLSGRIPGSSTTRYAWPRITAISDKTTPQLVHLYRDQTVLLDVEGPLAVGRRAAEETSRQQDPAAPPLAWNARPVGRYRLDATMAELLRVAVSPNRVETSGETLTTLVRKDNEWWGILTCRLKVDRGELDSLPMRVPVEWAGPFEVHSATHLLSASVTPIDDRQASVVLHVTPALQRGEKLMFDLRSPLASGGSRPVAAPQIALETQGARQHYVSVPARLEGDVARWTHLGVNPAELPEGLRPEGVRPQVVQSFQVMASPFRVALDASRSPGPAAAVRLADTIVMSHTGSARVSVTRFVLAPSGLVECVVELPDEEELVALRLDRRPALAYPDEARPGAWNVHLGSPQLPQILDVVTRHAGAGKPGARRVALRRPTLWTAGKRIPVELSLWSLGPRALGGQPVVAGAAQTTALDQAILRLDRLVSIAEAATPAAAEGATAEALGWFHPWSDALHALRNDAQRLLADDRPATSLAQVTHPARDQLTAASERAAEWIEQGRERWMLHSDVAPTAESAWIVSSEGQWIHCVADGGEDRLTITLVGRGPTPRQVRLLGLLAIVGIAAGSIWMARCPAAGDCLWRWPQAAGVLVGVAYWAWLEPSWVGLVIAAASLILLNQGWLRRRPWQESSTVRRSEPRT